MSKSLKGTQTEKNLLAAFAGESQARNRYTYFASAAKKEGLEQIAAIFLDTADNEKEHAKVFFEYLEGGEAQITASYPAGMVQDTKLNLSEAAARGKSGVDDALRRFCPCRRRRGVSGIAASFKQISKVEKEHEARYRQLLANLEAGKVFKKESVVRWHCRNCGYVHEGKDAPKECPACRHPQAYYEIKAENY
jgi:rubrerythrin